MRAAALSHRATALGPYPERSHEGDATAPRYSGWQLPAVVNRRRQRRFLETVETHSTALRTLSASAGRLRRAPARPRKRPLAHRPAAGSAHRPGTRGPGPVGTRPLQRRDRSAADRLGSHGEDPRRTDPDQAGPARPGPGGGLCLRGRHRPLRHRLIRPTKMPVTVTLSPVPGPPWHVTSLRTSYST